MGIISRFTDIMKANTHAVLSRMEEANADKLLEQYIRETKDTLGQVKAETAAVMAEEMQEPVRGENLPPGSAPTTLTPGAVMSGLSLPVRVYPLPEVCETAPVFAS